MKRIKVWVLVLLLIFVYAFPSQSYADDDYTVSGVVWWDQHGDYNCTNNYNGLREPGEHLFERVRVELLEKQESGFFQGQYMPMSPAKYTWTDANGRYEFNDGEAGDYQVFFAYPSGNFQTDEGVTIYNYAITTPNIPTDPDMNSDAVMERTVSHLSGATTAAFVLGATNPNPKLDCGLVEACNLPPDPEPVEIEVEKVWDDGQNVDGIRPDEVEVKVLAGSEIITFTLNQNNNWKESITRYKDPYDTFDVSLYEEVNVPDGYSVSSSVDSFGNDKKVTVTNTHTPIPKYRLGDYVWHDENKNGIQDDGEPGLEGVEVTLTKPNGETLTDTTENDGSYLFEDLPDGDYNVTFNYDNFDLYVPTESNIGDDDAKDSDGQTLNVTINGADREDIDFGLKDKENDQWGGFVWEDVNKNGLQDNEEEGVPNVTVTLTVSGSGAQYTTTTDSSGNYSYTFPPNSLDGEVIVTFSNIPEGYVLTKTDVDDNSYDDKDSDGVSFSKTFTADDFVGYDLKVDLGIYKATYQIGDYVWHDQNGNGLQDDGEKGIEGVTVILKDKDGHEINRTKTDEAGKYTFDNLSNGDYKVEFSHLPEGYEPTLTDQGDDALDSDGLTSNLTIKNGDNMSIDLGLVKKGTVVKVDRNPGTGDFGYGRTLFLFLLAFAMLLFSIKRRRSLDQ